MNGAAQLAIVAGLAEEFLDDLREEVQATMPKPREPEVINYGFLADLVAARLLPQVELLAERIVSLDAKITIAGHRMATIERRMRTRR
jgi:hypothetical protein